MAAIADDCSCQGALQLDVVRERPANSVHFHVGYASNNPMADDGLSTSAASLRHRTRVAEDTAETVETHNDGDTREFVTDIWV